jgi:hypothetical protein
MLLLGSAGEGEVIERELGTLLPAIRHVIEGEARVNRLRFDAQSGMAVVSIPHFLPENFLQFRSWRECNFRSSTFGLAHLLEMLPDQANYERAIFQTRELSRSGDREQSYEAPCSRLGLAAFICRHFHSLAAVEGHIQVRTTVGTFKIFPHSLSSLIRFFPKEKASETHPLVVQDFQDIQKFARGQVRLSPIAYQRAYGRDGNDDERWRLTPMRLAMLVPSLDHPPCIRFTTQPELILLKTSREICKTVMRVFVRRVNKEPPEGIEAMEQWELIMTVIRQFKDADFVHPLSVTMVTEAFWAICTAACPDENTRGRIQEVAIEDFEEMLDNLRAEPSIRSSRVNDYLEESSRLYGLPYVCCFVAQALLSSMNCSIFLTISVASSQKWLEFLTGPDTDVFIE